MTTFNTVRDIFYSGVQAFRGSHDSISEIAFLVDEGYLSISTIVIDSKKEYKILLSHPDKLERFDEASGGGNSHVALKLLARNYLETNHGCKSVFERPFCGFYPDVLSDDKTVVVECGHTNNAEKMLTYFRQGNIKECIQIPYPSEEDKEVKGYSFLAKDNLKDFLNFFEKEKRDQLKNIFFKRK